jgi:FtsH-binding integral membrane protein
MKNFTKPSMINVKSATYDIGLRSFMIKVFNYMALALTITGIVSYLTISTPVLMQLFFSTDPTNGTVIGISGLGYLITFAPLAFVFAFSMGLGKMSVNTAQIMFWIFSMLMGLSLSPIFLAYTGESIARVFFITASVFAAMSIYGYTTKTNLTNFGSFLFMGLIGIVIASLVNLFLQSPAISFVTSVISVLVFTGLTAYDVQRITMIYETYPEGETKDKAAIMGSLSLYMDFINMFLALLRLFGNRK